MIEKDERNVEYAKLLLGDRENDYNFRLITNDPEFEIIFFEDKTALEVALGYSISPMVWKLSLSSPKEALRLLLDEKNKTIEDLLSSRSFVELLRRSEKILKIREFIQATEEVAH